MGAAARRMSLSHEVGREDNHSVSTVLPQDPNQALVAVIWELLRVGSSIFPLQGYWSSCPNLGSSLLVQRKETLKRGN